MIWSEKYQFDKLNEIKQDLTKVKNIKRNNFWFSIINTKSSIINIRKEQILKNLSLLQQHFLNEIENFHLILNRISEFKDFAKNKFEKEITVLESKKYNIQKEYNQIPEEIEHIEKLLKEKYAIKIKEIQDEYYKSLMCESKKLKEIQDQYYKSLMCESKKLKEIQAQYYKSLMFEWKKLAKPGIFLSLSIDFLNKLAITDEEQREKTKLVKERSNDIKSQKIYELKILETSIAKLNKAHILGTQNLEKECNFLLDVVEKECNAELDKLKLQKTQWELDLGDLEELLEFTGNK